MARTKETYPIIGMECASCVRKIESILKKTDGITDAAINLASEKATIEYDDEKIDINKISEVVGNAGYELVTE